MKKEMEPIDKVFQDHREIVNAIDFLEKFLDAFLKSKAPDNYTKKVSMFCDWYIIEHFKWEENTLFPSVLNDCNTKEKELIEELQKEHPQILQKVDTFKNLVFSYSTQPKAEQVLDIVNMSRDLYEAIAAHAQKEERLFSVLKEKH